MNDFNEYNEIRTEAENVTVEAVGDQPDKSRKPKKPRKNHATLKVLSMILAVTIIGGGAGFGGAYLGNKAITAANSVSDNKADRDPNASYPTLDELQSNVSGIQHTVNQNAEFNSDGTYKYTRDLVRAVQDSIVYIEVYTNYGGKSTLAGLASGIIISSDGYIVTNAHVVEDYPKFTVKVNKTDPESNEVTSKTYDAKVVGSDEDTDLAVMKIDASGLQAAVLGDSDKLALGDDVVAIGNPRGLETSVSKGCVSGLNRQISDSKRGLSSIQTDAAINGGNSGGALFNGYGEVVGVVNEKLVNNYAESLGFAITINEAKAVIDDLITKGYVSGRAIIGISYNNISEYMASYRGMTAGWLVAEINPDLPVANSGLIVGDTIVKIDGKSVIDGSADDVLNTKKPGEKVTVTVARTNSFGREVNVDIEIELGESKGK